MDEAIQDVLTLTKTKMREAGEYSREAYEGFVEESVDYYVEKGRLSDEDDLDAIKEELFGMYTQVENEEVEDLGLDTEDTEEDEEEKDTEDERLDFESDEEKEDEY